MAECHNCELIAGEALDSLENERELIATFLEDRTSEGAPLGDWTLTNLIRAIRNKEYYTFQNALHSERQKI